MRSGTAKTLSILSWPLSEGQPWSRWTGVKLHAAIVLITALSFQAFEDPYTTLVLGGALAVPTFLFLAWMEGRKAPLWFSPLSFYFLWYVVGFGLSAIYIGGIVSTGAFISFSPPIVPPRDVALGYIIYLAGSLALHVGLQLFRPTGREERVVPDLAPRKGRIGGLAVLWLIGLWAVWSPAWIIPLGAPGRIFQWASMAALCAFALTPREYFGLSRMDFLILLSIGTAGLFVVNLMSYSKASIMFSFLPMLWLFIIRRSLRRWLPLLGAVLMLFYLVIVAPIVMTARLIPLRPGESPAAHLLSMFETWRSVGIESTSNSVLVDQVDAFLMRQFDPIAVGYLVGEVETYGLQLGATMTYVVYAFIPRILWPEKPSVTRGAWFAYYVGFAPSEEESTMSLGITAVGELYWNYGTFGVLAGMFVIGCLLGRLWRMAGADPRQKPLHMMLYVLVMLNMANMSEAVTVLVSIAVTFLTFKAVFAARDLLRRPQRGSYVVITS